MTVFKCKMCGGDLNITAGVSVCQCEYCGTNQTVPAVDNEKKLTLFARANRLRFNNEFDKAAAVYESIVSEFSEEAEAYWGLVLCQYGIEYVDDPKTGKKIPTCHRSSFESVMEDNNFELTLEYADPTARSVYREEAKAIEELRRGIIEVSSKEEPYDIFICYKETDDKGNRTIDSVIAQDVYTELTEKGYRVFFSRITLEDKLGTEYEPYIFAALHSAKIMLAFGTDYEYYNAAWVKNEWNRFLQLIEKGEKKTLIPCYKGIDAYDMPKEFAKLQAQDMGKVGATQDLLRGIEKILPHKFSAPAAALSKSDLEKEHMLKKADTHLSMGDFDAAIRSYKDVSYEFPDDYRGWLGEINCRTHSFTNFNIGKTAVLSIQHVVDKALLVAPERQKELISAKWRTYSQECIRLEDERIRKQHEENERIRIQKEQAEEARQRQLAAERAQQEAEAQEQKRKREAEKERQRLEKEQEERSFKIKQLICSLIIIGLEILFFSLMITFDFVRAIDESLGGFICVNVALLANALIIGITARIGCVKFGTYIASGVNAIFATWIFFFAMASTEGILVGVLAFFFFGAIELGVIWLSYVVANAISTLGT